MTKSSPYAAIIDSPLGFLGIRLEGQALAGLDVLPPSRRPWPATEPLAKRVVAALERYFSGEDPELGAIPLALVGTPFQCRVWAALRRIPRGETRTYGELARELGTAPRAVGGACRSNPVAILIPCHRVISVQGLGGYAGALTGPPLARKQWLLRHEGHRL